MHSPAIVYRTIRVVNGRRLAVTNHTHARLLGFTGGEHRGSGRVGTLTIAFAKGRGELYVNTFGNVPITYHFLESGVGELLRRGIRVGDRVEVSDVIEMLRAAHLYTGGTGVSEAVAEFVTGAIVGEHDFGPDVLVVEENAPPVAGNVGVEELTSNLVPEPGGPELRMLAYQEFGEMMYNLALLQQWGGELEGMNEGAEQVDVDGVDDVDRLCVERFAQHRVNLLARLDEIVLSLGLDASWTIVGDS